MRLLVHEVKGKLKEKVGQMTNDPDLEAEGLGERLPGRSRRRSAKWKKSLKSREPVVFRTIEPRRLLRFA
jgi:uncharacterized protein YjbJ (UPF0337 family)